MNFKSAYTLIYFTISTITFAQKGVRIAYIDFNTIIEEISDYKVATKNLETNTYKAFDKDNKEITLDMNAVEAEFAKLDYQTKRMKEYPSLRDLADAMYWNSKGDSSKLTAYYAACEKVKTDNPKP